MPTPEPTTRTDDRTGISYPTATPRPRATDVPVVDPDQRVSGHLTIAFLERGHVHVATDNDRLLFRSRPFAVRVNLSRHADGDWHPRDGYPLDLTNRNSAVGRPATKHFERVLLAAITRTVRHHWTPELDEQAAYAHAVQQLRHLDARRDTLLADLANVETERTPHLRAVADPTARTDTP